MFGATPDSANFWFDLSNVVLLLGAVAVAAGTYGVIKMGSAKERFSDERISSNELETKRAIAESDVAKAAAAEANEKAESEKLERTKLEAKVAPRRLSPDQKVELAKAWAPLSGKSVLLESYSLDVDSALLGQQLIEVLAAAKAAPISNLASSMPMGGFLIGIHITGRDKKAAIELAVSLHNIGDLDVIVDDGARGPPGGMMMGMSSGAEGTAEFRILIGPKPLK